MLRSHVVRVGTQGQASLFNRHAIRTVRPTAMCMGMGNDRGSQQRRHEHAISNPTLANIEKRWEQMPPQEQAELWMALRDRMKVDWHQMTWQEKKAGYWIAFGPHGPRALPPPGENWKIFGLTMAGIALAAVIFAIMRQFANPPPRTMTREWQEKTNEYLKSQRVEPITGISSEGYTGRGQIQSPPARK